MVGHAQSFYDRGNYCGTCRLWRNGYETYRCTRASFVNLSPIKSGG